MKKKFKDVNTLEELIAFTVLSITIILGKALLNTAFYLLFAVGAGITIATSQLGLIYFFYVLTQLFIEVLENLDEK